MCLSDKKLKRIKKVYRFNKFHDKHGPTVRITEWNPIEDSGPISRPVSLHVVERLLICQHHQQFVTMVVHSEPTLAADRPQWVELCCIVF